MKIKKIYIVLISFIGASFLISSCAPKIIEPYYTSVKKMYNLTPGTSFKKVNETLGIQPYDFYFNTNGKTFVYVYKYLHEYHTLEASIRSESALNMGEPRFKYPGNIYMIFDQKNKKLLGYYTDNGRLTAISILKHENTIRAVNKDYTKYNRLSFKNNLKTQPVTVPYATTIVKTSELNIGINKKKVPEILGVYPFDIYQNYENSCEIHHYIYKDMQRDHSFSTKNTTEGLTNGAPKYIRQKDLYLIFRDDKLESMITGSGIKGGYELMYFNGKLKNTCNNPDESFIEPEYEYVEEDADCEYCKIIRNIIEKGSGNVNVNLPTPSKAFEKKYKKVIKK